jgi:hypothetical protein
MCFGKMKFGSLNFAPDSKLALSEGRCPELCSVQSVVITSSGEVIGTSSFRNASIEAIKFESGSCLQWLIFECFADCSSQTIHLPIGLEALPSSCFMDADIDELTFEGGSFLR